MSDRLDWAVDGRDWPNRQASSFVTAGGIAWHVQRIGAGPVVLLLHGTGSSTHSWRQLAPLLARRLTVIAPDLPGHAFTDNPGRARLTLDGMARLVGELVQSMDVTPQLAVGHSAGAAVLMRMCLDRMIAPRGLISLNGALLPLGGFAGSVFSPLAKMLVVNPFVPRLFAWRAQSMGSVRRLLEGTGSRVRDVDLELYARLFRNPAHVAGTLAMMAGWDLHRLERDMPRLSCPLLLVTGSADRAIPPADAERVHALVPGSEVRRLQGLGHLAHEESPEQVASLVEACADELGIGD